MVTFRIWQINLLGLYVILSHNGCCFKTVWQPPKPRIAPLQAISDKQTLLVKWLVNHRDLVSNIYEIQISRTEHHTVIYDRNLSLLSVDSYEYTWTWTSDLPLECVDHSVRIRYFYNQSVLSTWSDWLTINGAKAKDQIEIFPSQRVLREGTSAMFCCVPPRGVNITSIIFNNSEYPLISIGTKVKAITVDNLTIPTNLIKSLTLTCNGAAGTSRSVWNYVSFPPQKPRNLSCVTSDMATVTCTWDPGRERDPFDQNDQTHTVHIQKSNQIATNCKQSSCTFPVVPHLEEYNIRLVVKDQLGEETESYSFNISDRVFPVVEWDRMSRGATNTTVSWLIQGNLTQLDLLCQVSINPGSTTELSCNSLSGICRVKLEHLLPNTHYSTRVRCSVDGRLWGEWTRPISFTTYPLVTLDVWRRIKQQPDPDSRQVTLFWIPHVSGSPTMVNIRGYIVQWSQRGQNGTEWKVSGQTQAEVPIGSGQYEFTVKADLHTGISIPAHITIPWRDDGEHLPVEERLSSSTAAGFNLSWEEQDTAPCGYIVEWHILGNAVHCTPDVLRWMRLPQRNNTLSLPAKNFTAGCRYTFNIYGCTQNGHRLLATQTGYSQELKSVQPPSLVEPVQSASSSVTLEWRYNEDDVAHPAFITGYLVTVQEVASENLPGHAAKLFSVPVADPQKKSVTIKGLQQNQEYEFSVSALTNVGPGQPANITIRTRASLDSAHLAKIITPILLLLCCIVLLWPQRKTLKSGLKGMFVYPAGMNIKTPDLDSFPRETCEWLQSQQEECGCCDIEVLNTRFLLNDTTTPSDPELLDTLASPGSQSFPLTCVSLHADYCPQSFIALSDRPALQQIADVSNKTYFHTMEEDLSEAQQVTFTEINDTSESAGIM